MPFKLLRSQSSTTNQSKNSRLSFNLFYFATGDTQKERKKRKEKFVKRSTTQTKTYSGQVVPMIGFATLTFSYDPDGQFSFPLTVWIVEMKNQNLLGMEFCQKRVYGIHFDSPAIELKEPPNTVFFGSLHQNNTYPFISQILTIRNPHAMHNEAKSARC